MRFVDFVDAVRSAWGAAENATVVLAILAGAGLSATFGTVPTLAAMAACLVFYIAGFLCACCRNAVERFARESVPSPSITLDDIRAAEDRARARADAELASMSAERDALRSERDELVAKVGRLEKIVEAGERAVGNAYYADMMADYDESGIGKVGASPVDAASVVETGEVKYANEDGEQLV